MAFSASSRLASKSSEVPGEKGPSDSDIFRPAGPFLTYSSSPEKTASSPRPCTGRRSGPDGFVDGQSLISTLPNPCELLYMHIPDVFCVTCVSGPRTGLAMSMLNSLQAAGVPSALLARGCVVLWPAELS